jgi:hypothetical protein
VHSLVVTIRDALGKREKTTGDGRRARRQDDQRHHEIAVETVVANLAHAALFDRTDSRLRDVIVVRHATHVSNSSSVWPVEASATAPSFNG